MGLSVIEGHCVSLESYAEVVSASFSEWACDPQCPLMACNAWEHSRLLAVPSYVA